MCMCSDALRLYWISILVSCISKQFFMVTWYYVKIFVARLARQYQLFRSEH